MQIEKQRKLLLILAPILIFGAGFLTTVATLSNGEIDRWFYALGTLVFGLLFLFAGLKNNK